MPQNAVVIGLLLIVIGLVGYVAGSMQGHGSITALIPAFIGAVIGVCGAVAHRKESLRKHLMHAALLIALLGLIATAARLLPRIGEFTGSLAQLSQLFTALLCLIFIVLGIRSFIAARSSRG